MSDNNTQQGHTLIEWRPDDQEFWETKGKAIASRNLWISIPALLLAFSVWLVWSVVVAKLPAIGFDYTTDELFLLAALPGISGATLRIFTRLWCRFLEGDYGRPSPQLRYCFLRLGLAMLCKIRIRLTVSFCYWHFFVA